VLDGVLLALKAYSQITEIVVVGDEGEIRRALSASGAREARLRIVHASEVFTMEDKPLVAVRRKKDSSLIRAIELVKEGKAEAVISTGNTGGLVAAATLKLRRLEGVDRPAIATFVPSLKGQFILLDAGANPECKPLHLVQFAVMGHVYAREILGQKRPRIGVLCNGTESHKGNDLTRDTARLCQEVDFNFLGYVEGNDMFAGNVDVVVTDGFVGNIVLKTIEGLGKCIVRTLKSELTANPIRQIGAAVASGALRGIKRRMDPDAYGGAPLVGLNGTVIKAHGSARETAIKNAIRVATETIQHRTNEHICREIAAAHHKLAARAAVDAGAPEFPVHKKNEDLAAKL
jgi:glycerol-3-phosphate acyltransferase PlsX